MSDKKRGRVRLILGRICLAVLPLSIAVFLLMKITCTDLVPRQVVNKAMTEWVLNRVAHRAGDYRRAHGSFPVSIDVLLFESDTTEPIEYVKAELAEFVKHGRLTDVWGHPVYYSRSARDAFVLTSAGRDGILGSGDDIHFDADDLLAEMNWRVATNLSAMGTVQDAACSPPGKIDLREAVVESEAIRPMAAGNETMTE